MKFRTRTSAACVRNSYPINRSIGACAIALLIGASPGLAAPAGESDQSIDLAAGLGALAVAPASEGFTPKVARRVVEGAIRSGKSLSELLRAEGVTPQVVNDIARGMHGHWNFRHARAGHTYRLVLDATGALVEFRYRLSADDAYILTRRGDQFQVRKEETHLEARTTRIAGVITTSLYEAIAALGEEGQLARDFSDIFAWDIDFQRSVQPGDSFQILYERLYRRDSEGDVYVRPGRILAARFEGHAGQYTAVYFQPDEGRGGYYRPNGASVEGAFLMAPVRHGRVTSSFSSARRHPILKVTRPHHGIDYAAPLGTPVWSVGHGKVIHASRKGGAGNLVKIRHDNGYVSYYLHLTRFAKGLRVGDRVEQKQVIGYVGQTGLATGPHVCFRMQQNGKYVNPARLRTPSGDPIPGELVPTFRAKRDLLLASLDGRRQLAEKRP